MMYMMYMIYMMYMMLCYFVPLYIQNRGRIMISILKCGEENQSQLSIKNQKKRKKKKPSVACYAPTTHKHNWSYYRNK